VLWSGELGVGVSSVTAYNTSTSTGWSLNTQKRALHL
jgi:hypothetical protein